MDTEHTGAECWVFIWKDLFPGQRNYAEAILSPSVEAYMRIISGARYCPLGYHSTGREALELVDSSGRGTPSGAYQGLHDQCGLAIKAGMNHACHFYNAMTPLATGTGAVGAYWIMIP